MTAFLEHHKAARLLVLLLFAGAQSVRAEEGGAAPNKAAEKTTGGLETPNENVPPAEMDTLGEATLKRMREILSRMLKLQEAAREEQDLIKLNCVRDKLTAVKGLLKVSEQADLQLKEALAKRDFESAANEFHKVSIAGQKSDQLAAQAEGCVGSNATYAGDTVLEMTVDPSVGPEPSEYFHVPDIEVDGRPDLASPF